MSFSYVWEIRKRNSLTAPVKLIIAATFIRGLNYILRLKYKCLLTPSAR